MLLYKTLHIIFMVTWFAGLFYLPRLYVYHAQADDQISKDRFKIMERKLFWGIMTPGGILTILFGVLLVKYHGMPLWLQLKSLLVFIGFSLLASCAYKPVVDTAGRSGTFNENKAHEITNDIQHCKKLAENNTSFLSNLIYWIGSVEADTEYQAIYRKCLVNRGHSVLN